MFELQAFLIKHQLSHRGISIINDGQKKKKKTSAATMTNLTILPKIAVDPNAKRAAYKWARQF